MNEEKKNKLRIFIIYLLVFIVVIIFELFICKTAFASELVRPSTSIDINNTTYYGYDLPTRPTMEIGDSLNGPSLQPNSVRVWSTLRPKIQITEQIAERWEHFVYNAFPLKERNLNNYVNSSVISNNIQNIPTIWTNSFDVCGKESLYCDFTISFLPGMSTNNVNDVFENGYKIDYSQRYSYSFDIVLYNESENADLGAYEDTFYMTLQRGKNGLNEQPQMGYYNCNNDNQCYESISGGYNNGFLVEPLIYNEHIQYYRIHVLFNSYNYAKVGFGSDLNYSTSIYNDKGVIGNNVINFTSNNIVVGAYVNNNWNTVYTKVQISQPYNIKLWSTQDSFMCTNNCWTQDDTNNNQEFGYNDGVNQIEDLFGNLNYFGFSGIVNTTYNFVISLLEDTNNECIELNIPLLGKNITLPSSCTFWRRNDVQTFSNLWKMIILGVVSYFIAWKIYKDLLYYLYSPSSKLSSGKEVDTL